MHVHAQALAQLHAKCLNSPQCLCLCFLFPQTQLQVREAYLAAHLAPLQEAAAKDAALHELQLAKDETDAQLKAILAKTDAYGDSYAVKKSKGAKPFADLDKLERVS